MKKGTAWTIVIIAVIIIVGGLLLWWKPDAARNLIENATSTNARNNQS